MGQAADKATAQWVLRRLRDAGYQALFAGGCVRDMLLHRPVSDYDIATDASPQQVRKLFRRVLLVGEQFGVAMVIKNRRRVEVATFRTDLSYTDGRRPDGVRFANPKEDALRRDFTINGMFYDPVTDEVIDYVGGREDLGRKVVRTIGEPDERFSEDYLRLVRAVRFAVRLGFRIDPATAEAIRKHAPKITAVSGERIFDELSKMLREPTAAGALEKLAELDLAPYVLGKRGQEPFSSSSPSETGEEPSENGKKVPDPFSAAVARVAAVADRKDLTLTLAALLCDLPAKTVSGMIRRWGASNDLRDAIAWLGEHRDDWQDLGEMDLATFRKLAGHRQFDRLRAIWQCRAGNQAAMTERLVTRRLGEIPDEPLPKCLLTGTDLIQMGMTPGPAMGKLIADVYDAQLNLEIQTRKHALARARDEISRAR